MNGSTPTLRAAELPLAGVFRRVLLLSLLVALAMTWPLYSSAQETPSANELEALIEQAETLEFESFSGYLDALIAADQVENLQAIRDAMNNESLTPEQLDVLARLLGVYNRVINREAALDTLSELVAIETYASPEYPEQHENPAFIEFGEKIQSIADEFGMKFRNVGGRIFEVTLDGPTDDVFGVLTHADVVPVQSREWRVEEGETVNPFDMQIIGNRIYGRGTIDDKGSISTALYAMKAVGESALPLQRDIRLMIETTEETSGLGMQYYLENETAPDYNIVLDSDYPAVIAEKGYGTITATFPIVAADSSADSITRIVGSAAANQIPESAVATISSTDATALADALNGASADFIAAHGGDFAIDAVPDDGIVTLTVKGTSAHASEPEAGVNPVPRLAAFLRASEQSFADNHYWHALTYIDEAYGFDYLGQRLDLAYEDEFMGPLTLSPTYFEETDGGLMMAVNVRAPRHPDTDVGGVKADIVAALEQWKANAGADVAFDVTVTDWMYRDSDGTWLNVLLDIYGGTTGNPAEPISSAGSTTAKLLPNAVNFGPNLPTDKYMGHTENEFKRLDVFEYDLQMFAEMMVRISNLPSME